MKSSLSNKLGSKASEKARQSGTPRKDTHGESERRDISVGSSQTSENEDNVEFKSCASSPQQLSSAGSDKGGKKKKLMSRSPELFDVEQTKPDKKHSRESLASMIPGPEVLEGNRKSKKNSRKRRNSDISKGSEECDTSAKKKKSRSLIDESQEVENEISPSLLSV